MGEALRAELARGPERADRIVALLRRRPLVLPGLTGALVGAGLAYTAWQDPTGDGTFPRCVLNRELGIDCVGCGGLRAVHALLHGDPLVAADHNLFVTVALPVAVVAWMLWLRSAHGGPRSPLGRLGWPAWAAFGIIALVFGVARNVDGTSFTTYLGSS